MNADGDDIVYAYGYEIENRSFDGGAGQDTFQLKGGGYFNISLAADFTGFEIIQGTLGEDTISIAGSQLADVQRIDGGTGYNYLYLSGPTVDLTGKSILGFQSIQLISDGMTVQADSFDVAHLLWGMGSDNDGLVLEDVNLTNAQRLILHNQGIDRITDATGDTTVNEKAQIAGLGGDRVIVTGGQYTLIDVGRDAVITDDRGAIRSLEVSFRHLGQHDVEGIFFLTASDRVTYETSSFRTKAVYVDGVLIGTCEDFISLSFNFNNDATPERVTEVLRAIAFRSNGQGYLPAAEAAVDIRVTDAGGRVTQSSMILENANDAPAVLDLIYGKIEEGAKADTYVGWLTAGDRNMGDTPTLRYSLVDDADGRFKIVGDRLVVADGAKLDFEQAQTHQVVIRVTDRRGLYLEKTFTIDVTDNAADNPTVPNEGVVGGESLVGGRGKDTLSGGAGNDSLSGGTGDDVLYGGAGHDVLKGGGSADKLYGGSGDDILYGGDGKDYLHGSAGKDAFAFTSKATGANIDRIADFNVKYDRIYLDNRIFTKLGKQGSEVSPAKLSSKFFTVGDKARDKDDYVIHDREKGVLLYDADGSGSRHEAAEIATLSKNLKLSASHLFVI
ncbi:cadherin domain-containing protein [Microvirga terrae]|uniref:Cadherin domain-containing protein n=1 Tax=Microvirga terrae TaxID=2740529 RepID=A0ABY5RM87_9HYPH|nr:cadherin domain-containing protein [Microvirga terrae]UVF18348.1 cadherin domain-containing protein [Microvirga terrae]